MPPAEHPHSYSGAICTALCLRELTGPVDPIQAFERMRRGAYPWLLDTALRTRLHGRHTFAGCDPYLVMRARGSCVEIDVLRDARPDLGPPKRTRIEHDPFDVVRGLLPSLPGEMDPLAKALPFTGGAVGYWGYELAEHTEPVSLHGRDDLGIPDLVQLFVDRLLAVDHETGRAFAVGLGFAADDREARVRAEQAARELAADLPAPICRAESRSGDRDGLQRRELLSTKLPPDLRTEFDESRYAKSVSEILVEIEAGNVYQADLTHRMQRAFAGDPWRLYRALRRISPAPFAAYLELPEVAILSSSPERFLCVDAAGRVESRPIKGTRPRGQTAGRDEALRADLARSPKDRAENLMIVDLMRNDLGRVCETGSIAVPELWAVERYAAVFQMVSTVTGQLRGDRDAIDLLRAAFPPGSMTGAPKIAAMRLLDRLEPVRRGIYSGALGYLDVRGGADLCVVIRTILVGDGQITFHVGGGVVADSDPVGEYHETLDKARALLAAMSAVSD